MERFMTPKEKAIKEAYGELYDYGKVKEYIDPNGWCHAYFNLKREKDGVVKRDNKWQPSSLTGIETNRGWIRIESGDDLPKQDVDCFLLMKGKENILIGNYDIYKQCFVVNLILIHPRDVSHYQYIVKPEKPIY